MQQMQHSFISYYFSSFLGFRGFLGWFFFFFPLLACECIWFSKVVLQITLLTACGLLHTHTDLWGHRSHSSENHSTALLQQNH